MPIDKKRERESKRETVSTKINAYNQGLRYRLFMARERNINVCMFARMPFISANGIILLHYFL